MIAYVIKSIIYLSILYIPYMLMLQRESFFKFNRKMLVLIMALSLVLPLVNIPAMSWGENSVAEYLSQEGYAYQETPTANAAQATEAIEAEMPESINWWQVLSYIYIIGGTAVLVFKLFQLAILRRKIRHGTLWTQDSDGILIFCHADNTAPYSWFNNIVISQKDYDNNATEIIRHEIGHVRNGHSWDILLLNIVQTVQWINPMAWIIGNSLRDVHEFEADDYVLKSGIKRSQYQSLLLSRAMNQSSYTFANGFHQSMLLKRFNMMVCQKSNPWMRAKFLYILPLAVLAMAAFAHPSVSNELGSIPGVSLGNQPETAKADTVYSNNTRKTLLHPEQEVLFVCEQMPTFPGGNNALQQFLSNNIKYPEAAIKKRQEGRVVVQFIIDSDGTTVEPKVIRGVSQELDAEALRVISLLPKWNPGMQNGKAVAVRYNVPLTFRLVPETDGTTEMRLRRRYETSNL